MPTTSVEHVVLPARYAIQRPLGEGGMATVFLVHDSMLGVNRAVKVLNKALVARPNIQRRFAREARTMAQIRHANVVTVFDVIQTDAVSAIVMDFVEGGSLYDLLEQRGMLAIEEALAVMHEVAAGVEAAHSFGVIHRDIKPHNILLEPSGVPKLSDFGIARQVEQSQGFTRTGAVLGTMAFMAPEQRSGVESIDLRADVYAMGATLYVLVTGRTPFDLYAKEFHQRLFDGVPAVVAAIVKKACSFRPEERYDSARAFADHIRDVLDVEGDMAALLPRPVPGRPTDLPSGLTTSYDPTFDFDSLEDGDGASGVVQLGPGPKGSIGAASQGQGWWEDSVVEPKSVPPATPTPPPANTPSPAPSTPSAAAALAGLPVAPDTVADEQVASPPPSSHASRTMARIASLLLASIGLGGVWWTLSGERQPMQMGQSAVSAPVAAQKPEPHTDEEVAKLPPDNDVDKSVEVATNPETVTGNSGAENKQGGIEGGGDKPSETGRSDGQTSNSTRKKETSKGAGKKTKEPVPPSQKPPEQKPKPVEPPEPVPMGRVIINTIPAGRYTVAGQSGETPAADGVEIPVGVHTVELHGPEGRQGSTRVRVRADKSVSICWNFEDAAPCAF